MIRDIKNKLQIHGLNREFVTRRRLPFPRKGSNVIRATKRAKDKGDPAPYRELWLGVLRDFPDLTQRQLQRQAPHVYGWLAYNDSDWLRAQWPRQSLTRWRIWPLAPVEASGTDEMIKDEHADRRLADAVIEAAELVKAVPGELVRITKYRLRYYFPSLLPQTLSRARFPVTFAAIRQVCETREDLLIRRIEHVVAQSDGTDQPRTRTKLVEVTVANAYKNNPRIKQALDDAMMMLLTPDH